jgi:hypothetical protein
MFLHHCWQRAAGNAASSLSLEAFCWASEKPPLLTRRSTSSAESYYCIRSNSQGPCFDLWWSDGEVLPFWPFRLFDVAGYPTLRSFQYNSAVIVQAAWAVGASISVYICIYITHCCFPFCFKDSRQSGPSLCLLSYCHIFPETIYSFTRIMRLTFVWLLAPVVGSLQLSTCVCLNSVLYTLADSVL